MLLQLIKKFLNKIKSVFQSIVQWINRLFSGKKKDIPADDIPPPIIVMPPPRIRIASENKNKNLLLAFNYGFLEAALEIGNSDNVKKVLESFPQDLNLNLYDCNHYNLGYYKPNYGVGPISFESKKHTPITYTLAKKQSHLTLILLKKSINLVSDYQYESILATTLVHASYYNDLSVLEFCLKNISNTEQSQPCIITALNIAISNGNLPAIKLFENGSNLDYPNLNRLNLLYTSRTLLDYAIKTQKVSSKTKEEIVLFFLNKNVRIDCHTLQASLDFNFSFNFNEVHQAIEYFNEAQCNTPNYELIKAKIQKHNEGLELKITDAILNAFPKQSPTDLAAIICEYVSFKPKPKR